MSFEFFVAARYLLAKRKQTFISVISFLSIAGVGLGVAALIVVLGVMTGFSENLRDKILGMNPHVIINATHGFIPDYRLAEKQIARLDGIRSVSSFLYTEVILSFGGRVKGSALRGVDVGRAEDFLFLQKSIKLGSLERLSEENSVLIGSEMADLLGLSLGSQVHILSPSGSKGVGGFRPKVMTFTVVGIFKTGMFEYDASLVYTSLATARKVIGLKEDAVAGLEVRLDDIYGVKKILPQLREVLPRERFFIRNWLEMNENLFSAMQLEKTAMGIILAMIILVASFSIVTALVMLVMEKTRDIALLMSIGATAKSIRRIFILQGMLIGFIGTALGYALGLGIAVLLQKYRFIELPAGIYYMDHIPMSLHMTDLVWIGVSALVLCFLATLYPSRQAAKLSPVEALRYE